MGVIIGSALQARTLGYFLITNPSFVSCLQELEQIEEHYKQETRDLLSTVKRLQDENRKLASSLAAATERDSAFSEDGKFQFCCDAQLGQIEKKPPKIVSKKFVKLTDHTCACNNLTSFESEVHAITETRND